MDRVSRRSDVAKGVGFGDLWILLFADDVVLLASSNSDLLLSLGRKQQRRESASKSEVVFLSRKRWIAPYRSGESLLQVEEFKNLRVIIIIHE